MIVLPKFVGGVSIKDVVKVVCELSDITQTNVKFEFNGLQLEVTPQDTFESVIGNWRTLTFQN